MLDDPALILARHVRDTRFEELSEEAVVAAKQDILGTPWGSNRWQRRSRYW